MIKLERKGTHKYHVNKECLLNEDDVSFYLLGAYMTDGCIIDKKHNICFRIASKDKEWIETIRNIVCPMKPIFSSKESECYSFHASEIDCINWFISYGCSPRKSKTLDLVKSIPKKYYRDFIRGVIDGDGSISTCRYRKVKNKKEYWYTKNTVYICSASLTFLEKIKAMIPKEINCHFYTIKKESVKPHIIRGRFVQPTCDAYRLVFNESNAKKLLAWLYYSNHSISMTRKRDLAISLL